MQIPGRSAVCAKLHACTIYLGPSVLFSEKDPGKNRGSLLKQTGDEQAPSSSTDCIPCQLHWGM